jgi:acyl transferase domain-containing protein/NAD(P)H-dependent flavin oxidoreductase YrpB (nitropropane dioxygenase family)/acyl carrier protein
MDWFFVGISPFERPDVGLCAALCRAGALGVLDLGRDASAARASLAELARAARTFAVRIPDGVDAPELPPGARVVVLPEGRDPAPFRPRRVLAQVTSIEAARAAAAAGADGLIAKGSESGGRVGDETAFVLLQRIVAELDLPVWVQGGVGLHTAAACLAGGARGVVLDSQLALLAESSLAREQREIVAALDGSETEVAAGRRVVPRLGLPAGQDIAFARGLAEVAPSAARLVKALEAAARGHLRQARALDPLAAGAPLARAHGTRFPIAQGPMTRVSDRPAFAAAVAEAGALPFLALSLLRGEEARLVLEQSKRLLGERPWGVGLLGFAPPELREEQLAAVRAARPPVVLIAGGRPAQAAPLERDGIAVYLHVPSPGLLDLFWREGARRFVLEGRECGGHVGPRSSFVLWESAIARLCAEPDLSGASVLFAGGVHDARSAAMVAAAAAPLAARGARIGVLLGTAYLFTEEAVATGAIQPGFQEAAVACERTALLETGPGHATRCADTDYVRAFGAERERLEAAGASPREIWEALERLNLGRLRVAAKGLARRGEALVAVDPETQRREGMVMIGQVAALRRAVIPARALHEDVAASRRLLEAAREPAARAAAPVDVAIVGMAAVFPGAGDVTAYWSNLVAGRNAITEVPRERWDAGRYFDPAGTGEKTPSKWGGFLGEVVFDPAEYGIPPRSLAAIDPTQLLALHAARRALDDAGYDQRPLDGERASVIFGAEGGTDLSTAYGFRALHPQMRGELPAGLDEKLPRLTEDSFPGVLANVIAGRIANRLDLGGVNYTVDAACASSLAAVDLACKELVGGTSDVVICGGADLHNGIHDYLMFASVHALSPTGQCRPFDAAADGIALGEGVAALVLKRLADAERDGDRVYAVIKAVAGSSDGRSLGLTAPRKEGQIRALERAYERAGVSPADVELVEAHGTGTVVGDRTELATLAEIFGQAGAAAGSVALGSVKSLIGHTKCAAGLAGLIKAALAIHRRVLPPASVTRPNPAWDARVSPFAFRDVAQPWVAEERRAAVSAFGFGGTNFHVVLESAPGAPAAGLDAWPCELFVVRGDDGARLLALAESGDAWRLRDLAASAARGRGPVRQAFVAASLEELAAKLRSRAGAVEPIGGEVALLFPGQGSQRPNMLAELFVAFPELHDLLARGRRWLPRLFPPAAFTPEERAAQQAAITDTRVAQPVLGMVDLAVARLLARAGVRPAMVAGHSYGELAALAVAGAIPEEELLELSAARAECILEAAAGAPGTMAAVSASPVEIARVVNGVGVTLANRNAPDQTVIAGSEAAVAAAVAKLVAAGVAARGIPVACAFHSPIVAGGAERFARRLERVALAAPRVPVYANRTAARYPDDPDGVRAELAAQIAQPVRFAEEIEAMWAAGARVFVESGPGGVLANLVGRILKGKPHVAVACDRAGESGLRAFLEALARIAAAGVEVDAAALFDARDARAVDLERPGSRAAPATAWLVNGQRARPLRGELPEFGMTPVLEPVAAAAGGDREATVGDFLRGMREMVEAQKEVMLRYLGASPSASASASASPSPSVPASAPAPAPEPAPASTPMELLIGLVSARTGYPVDMIDVDLDLEADLGIDSIKRIEILGALGEKLGMEGKSELVEELAGLKTLRAIGERLGGAKKEGTSVTRYVLAPQAIEAARVGALEVAGKRFAITRDDRGVAEALASILSARGAEARLLDVGAPVGEVDGLVHLKPLSLDPAADPAKSLFARAKEAVAAGATWIVAATGHGGMFGHSAATADRLLGGGVAGLVKSIAKENPGIRARCVDLDVDQPAEGLAEAVFAEITSDDDRIEVGYAGTERTVLRLVRADRHDPDVDELVIGPESVVLLTGGTRGITGRVAVALAERYRCQLELVGRSPLPEAEDAGSAACPDAAALRRWMVETGERSPAAINARVDAVLAARATRATLAAIERAGGRWRHHAVDVRDAAAFGAVLDRIYEERGRIDGVIHGAGVIEDKLLSQKTPDSFDRVFDTKVAGALTLAEKLRGDVRFVVFFSSIAGAFGNRGQADYAAANDALDKLALTLSRCMLGRIVSINWGPWGGGGMVSQELEREYERRGIGLIPPEEGVSRLLDEIRLGRDPQVVLMSGQEPA